jgi:hypothetical protein
MTGMLLEIRNKTSIVLGGDGLIYRIKRTPGDRVGKTIEISAQQVRTVKRKRMVWSILTKCLSVAIVILLAVVVWQFSQALSMEALVQIDVESHISLYFTVDQNYTVVAVAAKDENGQKMLDTHEFKGLSVEQALAEVFRAEGSEGIPSAVIAVTSSQAHTYIENLPVYQQLSSESTDLFYVQPEQWQSYVGQDISPAKAALVQSMLNGDAVDSQTWVSKSVQDIREGLANPSQQSAEDPAVVPEDPFPLEEKEAAEIEGQVQLQGQGQEEHIQAQEQVPGQEHRQGQEPIQGQEHIQGQKEKAQSYSHPIYERVKQLRDILFPWLADRPADAGQGYE